MNFSAYTMIWKSLMNLIDQHENSNINHGVNEDDLADASSIEPILIARDSVGRQKTKKFMTD